MIRKLLVAFTALFLVPVLLLAQDGKLRGRVTDKESGEPLIGANVTIDQTTLGATTDINGDYVILSVPAGTYTVKASYIGYSPVSISNVRVGSNITITRFYTFKHRHHRRGSRDRGSAASDPTKHDEHGARRDTGEH